MKIWKSFSADHSAKLKIIGTFKKASDAEEAANLFNELVGADHEELKSGNLISGELGAILDKYQFHSFTKKDPEQMGCFSKVQPEGNKIIVETDEEDIQAIIKIFIRYGAEINIFSKHDYPDKI